jgi:hypothetical protein
MGKSTVSMAIFNSYVELGNPISGNEINYFHGHEGQTLSLPATRRFFLHPKWMMLNMFSCPCAIGFDHVYHV